MKYTKVLIAFIFLMAGLFLIHSEAKADEVTFGFGYFQCSRHGSGDSTSCTHADINMPDGYETYGIRDITLQGHRHGTSRVRADLCLRKSSNGASGICWNYNQTGTGITVLEYGDEHPWITLATPSTREITNFDPDDGYKATIYLAVEDAEARVKGTAFAERPENPDPSPTPPPPPSEATVACVVTQNSPSGPPVSGATCSIAGQSGSTNSDGYRAFQVETGTYNLSVSKSGYYNYSGSYIISGNVDLPVVLYTTSSGGGGSASVSCLPSSQNATVGVPVNFTAAGGSGSIDWDAPGGSPTDGNNSNFTTTYSTTGVKSVNVTKGSSSDDCTVNVSTGGSGGPCIDDSLLSYTTEVPSILTAGQVASFTIHAANMGTTSWYHGDAYRLFQRNSSIPINSTSAQVGATIYDTQVDDKDYGHLPTLINPQSNPDGRSSEVAWTFDLTAPATPGNYTFGMQYAHIENVWTYRFPDGTVCSAAPSENTYFGNLANMSFTVIEQTGNISVTSNVATSWTIAGPQPMVGSGTATTYENMPLGTYTITPATLAGYNAPTVSPAPGETKTLASNGSTIVFDINYTLQAPAAPSGLIVDPTGCNTLQIGWTDNAINETGFSVWRSPSGDPGTYVKVSPDLYTPNGIAGTGDTGSWTDNTVTAGNTYFYQVHAFNAAGDVASASIQAFNAGCGANLANSSKFIYQVNGAAYTTSTSVKSGDTVTFRIVVSNFGNGTGTINGIVDTPSSTLTNLRNITVDKGSGPVAVASFAAITGPIAPNVNWVVQFDSTVTADANTIPISNRAVINCTNAGGSDCSVTKDANYLFFAAPGTPQFREIAP